jgi:hypothetical protein
MTMMSGSTLNHGSGGGPGRSRNTQIAMVVVLAVVVFVAGVAITYLLRGRGSTEAQGTPTPCVSTTTHPGVTLPKPGTVSINVYNSTNRAGLARHTATTLTGRGFQVGKVANDPLSKNVQGVAELRYGPTGAQNAALLAYYVPGATLVNDGRADASVDVVLGAGFLAIPAPAAIQAALAKPVLVPGPGCHKASPVASPTASH